MGTGGLDRRALIGRVVAGAAVGGALSSMHSSEALGACGPSIGFLRIVRTDGSTGWTYSNAPATAPVGPADNVASGFGTPAFDAVFGTVNWKSRPASTGNGGSPTGVGASNEHYFTTSFTLSATEISQLCRARAQWHGDRTVVAVTVNGSAFTGSTSTNYNSAARTNDFNFVGPVTTVPTSLFVSGTNTIRVTLHNDVTGLYFGMRFALRLES